LFNSLEISDLERRFGVEDLRYLFVERGARDLGPEVDEKSFCPPSGFSHCLEGLLDLFVDLYFWVRNRLPFKETTSMNIPQ
jgi:hypothetical protein